MDLDKLWKEVLEGWAWQVSTEFITLLKIMQQHKVKNVLEIGCYNGGSAAGFLHIGCNVTSIDIEKRPRVESLEIDFPDKFRFFLRGQEQFAGYYHMLFIDGFHSYEACKQDYEQFSKFLKEGSLVVFHDILKNDLHEKQGCEVWKFWAEVKDKDSIEIIYDGTWGGIGVKFVKSKAENPHYENAEYEEIIVEGRTAKRISYTNPYKIK